MELHIDLVENLDTSVGKALRALAEKQAVALPRTEQSTQFRPAAGDHALRAITDKGELAAYVILRPWEEEGALWIGLAFTYPQFRRRGVYRKLLEAAEERAKDLGLRKVAMGVSAANTESAKAHLALGFAPTTFEREVR